MGIVKQPGDHNAFHVRNWARCALKADAQEGIVLNAPFGMVEGVCHARNLEGSVLEEDARLGEIVRHAQSGMAGDVFLVQILGEAVLKVDVSLDPVANAKTGKATRV